jgi:catalase
MPGLWLSIPRRKGSTSRGFLHDRCSRALFRVMTDAQKEELFHNIATSMAGVPENIAIRQLHLFWEVDPAYARGVAAALGRDYEVEPR